MDVLHQQGNFCGLCDKPETPGNLLRLPKKSSYGDQFAMLRRHFARVMCSHDAPDHRECRSKLRSIFCTDDESKLLEREKRAHCYPLELLDRVLLGPAPARCHKTCLGGLRVLIRLWNSVAISEANQGFAGSSSLDTWIRPVSSDSQPSTTHADTCGTGRTGSTGYDSEGSRATASTFLSQAGTAPRGGSGGSGVAVPPPLSASLKDDIISAPVGISPSDDKPARPARSGTRALKSRSSVALPAITTSASASPVDAAFGVHSNPLKRASSMHTLGLPVLPALPSIAHASVGLPELSWPSLHSNLSPLAGNPSRGILAQKRHRGLDERDPFQFSWSNPDERHAGLTRVGSQRSFDAGANMSEADLNSMMDHLMDAPAAAPKSRHAQVAMQAYLCDSVWFEPHRMASVRVKEVRRALHKVFKIKHPRALRTTPPRPAELFDATNTCLRERGMPILTHAEQEPYVRYHSLYSTAPVGELESDSFISDVSSELGNLSLSEANWDFPFGMHATVDAAAAAAASITHLRKHSDNPMEFDLEMCFADMTPHVSPSGCGPL